MATCNSCGANVEGTPYCVTCGAKVVQESGPTQSPVVEATPAAAVDTAPRTRKTPVWVALVSVAALALIAIVGGAFLLGRDKGTSQVAAPPIVIDTSPPQQDFTTPPPDDAPTEATATPLSRGQATAFINNLYSSWTARDQAHITSSVAPAYRDAFDPDFLDRVGVLSVTSYDNSETVTGNTAEVCGYQRFNRDDGMSQVERRCFQVQSRPTGLQVSWTGDQETVDTWRVT